MVPLSSIVVGDESRHEPTKLSLIIDNTLASNSYNTVGERKY